MVSESLTDSEKDNVVKLRTYLDSPLTAQGKVRKTIMLSVVIECFDILKKVRYQWRRRRTIVRRVLLQFASWIKAEGNKPALAT